MSKFSSFQLAIELAESKRDQALAELKRRQQGHAFAQGQMMQLTQYVSETELRWTRNAQASTTPELMRHHYQFMERLQQAIRMQETVLDNSQRTVQTAEQLLLQAEVRLASLKLVLTQRQAEVDKQHRRQDQKQMDEFAAMQTLRRQRIQSEHSHGH
jgi:flagellar FliJ protein